MITSAQIVARIKELPALPVVITKLLALTRDDRSTAGDFEKLIKVDVSLTANLLRVANSPLHRGASPTTTITQAIIRLGYRRVAEIATSGAFRKIVPPKLTGFEMTAEAFWMHCIAVAMLSERIAREARLPTQSVAFTAGLMHDIGKLAIGIFLADEEAPLQQALATQPLAFVTIEKKLLGTDHAIVGEQVAKAWLLPPEIAYTARFHHEPEDATAYRELVDVVHVANALAHSFGLGTDKGGLKRRLSTSSLTCLGLDHTKLESIVGTCFDDLLAAAEVLGDVGKGG